MTARKKLQNMLVIPTPVRAGTIISTDVGTIRVSTPDGVKDFQVANSGSYAVKGRIKYQGDALIGQLPSQDTIPTFVV